MENINDNVKRVLEEIAATCVRAGRPESSVKLVAASKMNDAARVREAFEAGVRAFGENRVQELEEKLKADAYEGAEVHFIGHLQRNKVKNVVGKVLLIHSVDSEELVRRIGKKAVELGITQNVLIEVNIGGEEAKSGVAPERLEELISIASAQPGIAVQGLMTIPPVTDNISETRHYFAQMRKLFVDMNAKKYDNVTMNTLSMGMSADFAEAIMEGANIVRVGTAIFGKRNYGTMDV